MKSKTTFIKLDRNIQHWRWYQNANTFRVFVHCLFNANIAPCEIEGVMMKRGEFATSYDKIAGTLKLTNKQVRTAIDHLKSTGEIATKIYSKFQVITVLNYGYYQDKTADKTADIGQAEGRQRAGEGQQIKNNKEYIKNKKEKDCPSGVSPVCVLDDGQEIFTHKNSGIMYVMKNGEMFDMNGKPLNEAGFPIIDFKLSKHDF